MRRNVAFRKWLVSRVEETACVSLPLDTDEELERHAQQLGVQPDVLAEARANVRMRLAQHGVPPHGTNDYDHPMTMQLCFAKEPWEAWQRHIAAWGVTGATLLRSLIHLYLQGTYEPEPVLSCWIWEGRRVAVVRGGRCREKTIISPGARAALNHRAALRGCSMMAILRGLVLDNMAGKFGQRGFLKLVDTRQMYGDKERYL